MHLLGMLHHATARLAQTSNDSDGVHPAGIRRNKAEMQICFREVQGVGVSE